MLLASVPGLGPPDLCWLQKSAKGSWSTVAAEPRGFFHFCLGQDVSSSAAIAAYFAELNALVEPVGFLQVRHAAGARRGRQEQPERAHAAMQARVLGTLWVQACPAVLTAPPSPPPLGTIMQGLWTSAETKIERGFYCCYDPFTRLDVRCELCIPGGVVCGALDAGGSVCSMLPCLRSCTATQLMI